MEGQGRVVPKFAYLEKNIEVFRLYDDGQFIFETNIPALYLRQIHQVILSQAHIKARVIQISLVCKVLL